MTSANEEIVLKHWTCGSYPFEYRRAGVLDLPAGRPIAAGFTLIEMMIVIAIAAILLAAAVPSFTDLIIRQRLQAEGSALMADLALARSEAVRQSTTVTVCASANSASCSNAANWAVGRITFVDQGTQGVFEPASDRLLRVNADASTADSLTPTQPLSSVSFRADGTVAAAIAFSVCHSGYKGLSISVSAVGRPRMVNQSAVCP